MSDPVLSYASPAPARPGTLRVAMWLHIASAIFSLLYAAYGIVMLTWAWRATTAFERKDFAIAGAISTTYGVLFAAAAIFCAVAIRRRRRRKLTRVLSIFPIALMVPIGTAAGLYTYIVLGSPKIRAVYDEHEHAKL